MASELKAYPEEYNELKTELDTLNASVKTMLTDINTKLLKMVSSTGPFYSKDVSAKLTGLLKAIKQDLHTPNDINCVLLDKYLCAFTNGLDFHDKTSS